MNGDLLLLTAILLFLVTIVAVVSYYRRIKRTNEEYEKARNVVEDIVISFNKQVERQDNRLAVITDKTEGVSSKAEKIEKKAQKYGQQLTELTANVKGLMGVEKKIAVQNQRLDDVIATQDSMLKKIEEIEKAEYKIPAIPETNVEAVIPIKREKALAPLTETELNVLHILATEGAKISSEIREKIKLTREHTARLMKKLYEAGYLERDTRKIPYAYRIKKEMLRILKKTDATS